VGKGEAGEGGGVGKGEARKGEEVEVAKGV
jgi:hypothetical protein